VLETTTNLPHDLIHRLTAGGGHPGAGAHMIGTVTAPALTGRSPAGLAAQSFPHTVAETVLTASTKPAVPAQPTRRTQTPTATKRPGQPW
jgi:hypothetical protein